MLQFIEVHPDQARQWAIGIIGDGGFTPTYGTSHFFIQHISCLEDFETMARLAFLNRPRMVCFRSTCEGVRRMAERLGANFACLDGENEQRYVLNSEGIKQFVQLVAQKTHNSCFLTQ